MPRALDGVQIADFTQMMQGPWATQKLADMGADVIKIERLGGEWERTLPAGGEFLGGMSPYFLAMNRNKRSLTLNLKSDKGREIALRIIEESDVVVENFRLGAMDQLGLGYEDAREVNPNVVYVSSTGFGPSGPHTDRPGQDLLMQSMSGIARYTGRTSDPPTPSGTAVVDEHTATLIALNTMFALFYRERTGEGQKVDANLLNSAIDMQTQEITAVLNMEDIEFERSEEGIGMAWLSAPYGIYETKDGWIAIAMAPMETVAEVLDLPEMAEYASDEAAWEKRDEIKRKLESYTRTQPTDELLETMLEADMWVAKVQDFFEMAEDPQVQHNEMIVEVEHPDAEGTFQTTGIPVSHSKTPGQIESPPPLAGQHNEEILKELGYDDEAIQQLYEEGVTEEV